MNIDPEYVDKQKDLEAIFEIAYTQGLPLSGECEAIAPAQRMPRSHVQQCSAETQSGVSTRRNTYALDFAATAAASSLEIQIAPRPCNWHT